MEDNRGRQDSRAKIPERRRPRRTGLNIYAQPVPKLFTHKAEQLRMEAESDS